MMTSLHVICGLGLPQSEIQATPMFERTIVLTLESQLKKIKYCSILLLLTIKFKTTFEILQFGVKFRKWFGPGRRGQGTLSHAIF